MPQQTVRIEIVQPGASVARPGSLTMPAPAARKAAF